MNSRALIYLVGFFLFLGFNSCDETIDVESTFSNKMVVDGIFYTGDTIKIYLFRNMPIAETFTGMSDYWFNYGLDEANVLLFDNDVLVDTLKKGKHVCNYNSKIVAKESHAYKITITHPDYPEVYATSIVPRMVPVDTVSYRISSDSVNMKMDIEFLDDEFEENYYTIFLYKLHNGFKQQKMFFNIDPIWGSELNFDFNAFGFNTDVETVLRAAFYDKWDNGHVINYQVMLKIKYESYFSSNNIVAGDTIGVYLYSVNRELYEYNRSIETYFQAQNSGAQPCDVLSNINQGAGIFTGATVSYYEFVYR